MELIPPGAKGSVLVMAQPITGGANIAVPIDMWTSADTTGQREVFDFYSILVCKPTPAPFNVGGTDAFRPAYITSVDRISLTAAIRYPAKYTNVLVGEAKCLAALGVHTNDATLLAESFLAWNIDPGVLLRQTVGALG